MNYLLLLFLVACCARPLHAQTEHAVSPATADPANGNPAPNNLHFAYVNPASTPRNRLVLFFPGTGGVAANYRLWVKHAANLGFHAISLTYPNAVAVNALCSNVADSTCHSRARLETFDGQDRHAGLAVDTLNCIRRRTLKLLQYLSATYPAENWGQYYRGNTILWQRIVVSGHSQGGGYAGLIAKLVPVDRVVQLAATDWVAPLGRLADWITWPSATPAAAYYGLIHRDDQEVPYALQLLTWGKFGLNAWGSPVLVDQASPPYQHTHRLYTQLTPALDPTNYHSAIVTDAYTPLTGATPTLAPAWTYLLTAPATPLAVLPAAAPAALAYPNPVGEVVHLSAAPAGTTYQLFDLRGRQLQVGQLPVELRLPTLPAGLYLLRVYNSDGLLLSTTRLSKL